MIFVLYCSHPVCQYLHFSLNLLHKIGSHISLHVYEINSIQRKKLHLAAVFVNNFVNHLYFQAHEICNLNQIPWWLIRDFILATDIEQPVSLW